MPPAPGMMASLVSGNATVAVELKTRKLVLRASSRPPPNALLDIAEMDGIGSWDRRVNVPRSFARNTATLEIMYQYLYALSYSRPSLLFLAHPNPFFQISTSTKGIVHLAGQYQRSCGSFATLSM